MRTLDIERQEWPIRRPLGLSRGVKRRAEVVVATITDGACRGQGEAVPFRRHGENFTNVCARIADLREAIADHAGREDLLSLLPSGAARNALDCALWDLESQQAGKPVHELAGLPTPGPVLTAYTLGLDDPEKMAKAARAQRRRPLLKLKLGRADGDIERLRAVRRAAPDSRLIVDANEGWRPEQLPGLFAAFAEMGVELVEQPLPVGGDAALARMARPVPVCADESCRDRADLPSLAGRYDLINIKLDKCGGLTEALRLRAAAREAGFGVMVGCMVATSLAMAPALLLAQDADMVDVDGPLMLTRDRAPGLAFDGSAVRPAAAGLWG